MTRDVSTLLKIVAKKLRTLISNSVVGSLSPAVFISGGIDSAIVLHHLSEKVHELKQDELIYTYTFGVRHDPDNEFGLAKELAKRYRTVHMEIELINPVELINLYAHLLDRPRINLWVALLYQAAQGDRRKDIYIGEGGDEHFGGYHYKEPLTYQEYWGPVLEWSLPIHRIFAKYFESNLHTPLLYLPVRKTLPFWDDEIRDKVMLREAYEGVLPDFVLDAPKNPGRTPWLLIWDEMIEPELGIPRPETRAEAQSIMSWYAATKWMDARRSPP